MDIEQIRQALYAKSPHDLASIEDDIYRDAIDSVLDPLTNRATPHPA